MQCGCVPPIVVTLAGSFISGDGFAVVQCRKEQDDDVVWGDLFLPLVIVKLLGMRGRKVPCFGVSFCVSTRGQVSAQVSDSTHVCSRGTEPPLGSAVCTKGLDPVWDQPLHEGGGRPPHMQDQPPHVCTRGF